MTTTIHANGSKWLGQEPDSIEKLFERLENNTLDPTFEDYGNFAKNRGAGVVHFWGNFHDVSAVFDIETDDPELVQSLIAAIKANQDTQAYHDAKHARAERLARKDWIRRG